MSIPLNCLKQNSYLQRNVKSTDTYFHKGTIPNHEKPVSLHMESCKLSFALIELFLRKNFTSYGRGKGNVLISGLLIITSHVTLARYSSSSVFTLPVK